MVRFKGLPDRRVTLVLKDRKEYLVPWVLWVRQVRLAQRVLRG